MTITIKSGLPLAESIGKRRLEVEWPGGTLAELIQYLHEKTGTDVERALRGDDGSIAYVISVNGKIQKELSALIHDGDEISFLLPIGGG